MAVRGKSGDFAGAGLGLEAEFGGLEDMGLRQGFFGAREAVEDEFAEETEADLAGDVEVVVALFVDEVNVVAGLLAADIDVFAQLDVALGSEDGHAAVAPGAEAGGGEPVDADVVRRAVVADEAGLAEVLEFRGLGVGVVGDGGVGDGGVGRAGEGEELFELVAADIGLPLVGRPSYVLGGRAMEIAHNREQLLRFGQEAVKVSGENPILIDQYLADAIEVDVDCIADETGAVYVAGVMEHIEEAGIHSGDSACSLPPYSLAPAIVTELKAETEAMARALKVKGLMNVQFAIQDGDVYVLEVNPRASRTVPYVSKATGLQLAKIAARAMAGKTLAEQGIRKEIVPTYFSVKEAVFPFVKFPGVDTILGPEMKSTGEVMGVGESFGEAFVKSQLAASVLLPESGTAFISVREQDKARAVEVARGLITLGFNIVATRGTAAAIEAAGLEVQVVNKVTEGRPHIVDMIKNGEVALVINTVEERRNAIADSRMIRINSLAARVTFFTTIAGACAAVEGLQYLRQGGGLKVYSLQDLHAGLPKQ